MQYAQMCTPAVGYHLSRHAPSLLRTSTQRQPWRICALLPRPLTLRPPCYARCRSADHGACAELASRVVNASASCGAPSCALGAPQPSTRRAFSALTGFYVVYHFFGLHSREEREKLDEVGSLPLEKTVGVPSRERGCSERTQKRIVERSLIGQSHNGCAWGVRPLHVPFIMPCIMPFIMLFSWPALAWLLLEGGMGAG
jgi:hypothetical protein